MVESDEVTERWSHCRFDKVECCLLDDPGRTRNFNAACTRLSGPTHFIVL